MIHPFRAMPYREGNRCFVIVPFNVWDETGRKGNIPCRIQINAHCFECKLLPKGNGVYWIPVNKDIAAALPQAEELCVTLEPIESLSRINHDSPYSRAHPVRKIDDIRPIPVVPGLCGHCCVAMLAGVSLEEVVSLMGKGHASWSKILEALDYYGIAYAEKVVYPKADPVSLPPCCIVNRENSFLLWFRDAFCGVSSVPQGRTIGYVEIPLPQKT